MPLPLNLAMTPSEIAYAQTLPADLAWMACHFSPDGTGVTDLPADLPKGALLILDDSIPCISHSITVITDALKAVISKTQCCGLLLDFQRPKSRASNAVVTALADALPCPVAVTPEYAEGVACPVFLPPAPLHIPLTKYLHPWKNREIWLEAALWKESITVKKDGTTFQIDNNPADCANYFHHQKLCCRYTTQTSENHIIFHLIDTPETLKQKLRLAQSLGVTRAVGLYQELGTFLTR